MTIKKAYQQLLVQLYEIYDHREAANIADVVIEHVTAQRKIDRIIYKDLPVTNEQSKQLESITAQLLSHTPMQYVLGEAWFAGIKLYVDESVLIPRPETEELVDWIIADCKNRNSNIQQSTVNDQFSIVDIGTGSGCIPIALAKELPAANIIAIDISASALNVAQRNADEQKVPIQFLSINFLNENEWSQLGTYDMIVSNPPYIRESEQASMKNNVLEFEPHLALFVPDNDPLVFYKKIASFAKQHLKKNGAIFLEINEALAKEVEQLFYTTSFNTIEIKKDMQGKDRMVKIT